MAAAALESRLGYRFRRPELLEQALTHRSFAADNNERLEFIGDGLLGCAIAEELFQRFPQLAEGRLTRFRSELVRRERLAAIAESLELRPELRLGTGVHVTPAILANTVEALFGAIHVLALAFILLAAAGAADVISAVFRGTILQSTVTDAFRGRLTAIHILVVTGGPRLGDLEAGLVASAFTPTISVVSGGFACIAGVLVIGVLMPQFTRYRVGGPAAQS